MSRTVPSTAIAAPKERRRRLPGKTLVLNADYVPLKTYPPSIVTAREAIEQICRERVDVVETWEDAYFRSPSTEIAIPKVVVLREYAPIHGRPKFCRRSIYLRDRFTCQYCGKKEGTLIWDPVKSSMVPLELTYDHVLPRAKGGKTVWENITTACTPCNAAKRDDVRMRPRRPPYAPTTAELLRIGLEYLPPDVKETWGDWLYWSQELKA